MNKKSNGSGTEIVGDPKASARIAGRELSSDDDTEELPALEMASFAGEQQLPTDLTKSSSVNRVASWVRHVEGEVERLRKRWESLDKKLAAANEQSAALQTRVEKKDAQIVELLAELDTTRKEITGLEATIAERDDRIKSLGMTSTERDEELTAVSRSLAEAEGRVGVLEDRLLATQQEVDELRDSVHEEKSRGAELRAEKEAALASNASLRSRLQDLEDYVDGRRDQWSDQQTALQSLETKISNLETALQGSERLLAERNATIESLEERICGLEREAGEIEGRHKEREAAHQEARALLQERIGEVERLKAQLEQRQVGADSAIEEASSHREQLEALRAALTEKDESIHRLEADLGEIEAVKDHIQGQQQADQETIKELQQELAQLQVQRDTLTGALDEARTNMGSLDEKLDEAEQATSELRKENEDQKRQIRMLESELEQRAEILAGFDANVQRLNQLGRDLNTMGDVSLEDERVPTVTGEHQSPELLDADAIFDPHDVDEHVETTLDIASHRLEHVNESEDDSALAELDIRDDAGRAQRRAMVELTTKNGDRPVHVISKPITTIGRAKSSDIRIGDSVISRTHARLRLEEDNLTIEDAGSKNGLVVNTNRVDHAVLKHGDVVSLGNGHIFRYVELEVPSQTH